MQDISIRGEQLPTGGDRRRGVTLSAGRLSLPLRSVLAGGLMVSVALAFGVRALARGVLDVPEGLPSLGASALLPAAVFPVLGNCFGYFMSFRAKPSAHSLRLFLGIGAVMTLVGIAISASKLPVSPSVASATTTVVVSLLPSVLIIFALLVLVRRPRNPAEPREQVLNSPDRWR